MKKIKIIIIEDDSERKKQAKHQLEKLEFEVLSDCSNETSLLSTQEYRNNENNLIAFLQEKELLFEALHHRIKNNMNIISGIFNLQIKFIKDEKTIEILKENQNRFFAISLIHEALYHSKSHFTLNVKSYVLKLLKVLYQSSKINIEKIKLITDISSIELNIEQTIYLGLIINELTSNALKHAFPGNLTGEIYISLKKENNNIILKVGDNGIGMSADFDWRNSDKFGLKLAILFAQDQLEGSIDLKKIKGTHFTVKFMQEHLE